MSDSKTVQTLEQRFRTLLQWIELETEEIIKSDPAPHVWTEANVLRATAQDIVDRLAGREEAAARDRMRALEVEAEMRAGRKE